MLTCQRVMQMATVTAKLLALQRTDTSAGLKLVPQAKAKAGSFKLDPTTWASFMKPCVLLKLDFLTSAYNKCMR